MVAMQQTTGSMISISIVARDDDGTLQRLFDVLTILAGQLLAWINIQLADPSHTLSIQIGILIDRLILLSTLMIDICGWIISILTAAEITANGILDWCEAFYLESAALWGEVGFLFTGRLEYA